MFSRQQLKHAARLTGEDLVQIGKCRRPHNRLGFAYQVAFVRLFNRFPRQQPFEIVDDLVSFSAAQLGSDARLLELYHKRQPRVLGRLMEKYTLRESCRPVYELIFQWVCEFGAL